MYSGKEQVFQVQDIKAIESIGLEVIRELEPDELPFAERTIKKLVSSAIEGKTPVITESADEAGGFGDVDLISTVVIPILVAVIGHILSKFGELGIEHLKNRWKDKKEEKTGATKIIQVIIEDEVNRTLSVTRSKKARKKPKLIKETITRRVTRCFEL